MCGAVLGYYYMIVPIIWLLECVDISFTMGSERIVELLYLRENGRSCPEKVGKTVIAKIRGKLTVLGELDKILIPP